MNKRIRMEFCHVEMVPFEAPSYEFKPNGRFAWVWRRLWSLMLKYRQLERHWTTAEKITSTMIDPDFEASRVIMLAQKEMLLGRFKPSEILVGGEEFANLRMQPEWMRYGCAFTGEVPWYDETGDKKLFNLKVRVIPHMRGILVI